MPSSTDRRTTTEADRSGLQALLDGWAEAIVANDAGRIASFVEPDWELEIPRLVVAAYNRRLLTPDDS